MGIGVVISQLSFIEPVSINIVSKDITVFTLCVSQNKGSRVKEIFLFEALKN